MEIQITKLNGKKCEKILKDLTRFSPTFKTALAKNIHETIDEFLSHNQPTFNFLFEEPIWFQQLVIRLIFDLQGSIIARVSIKKKYYKNKRYFQVQFENFLGINIAHPTLLLQLNKLLRKVGFHFNVKKDPRSWSGMGGLITFRKSDILLFCKIGGFLTNIRISKSNKKGSLNNNGFFKQTIFLASCELMKNFTTSKHFSTIYEAKIYAKKIWKILCVTEIKFKRN
jgi:hypothetical protein